MKSYHSSRMAESEISVSQSSLANHSCFSRSFPDNITGFHKPNGSKHCATAERIFLFVTGLIFKVVGVEILKISLFGIQFKPSTLFSELSEFRTRLFSKFCDWIFSELGSLDKLSNY
jgi:hypothetical protein